MGAGMGMGRDSLLQSKNKIKQVENKVCHELEEMNRMGESVDSLYLNSICSITLLKSRKS